MIEIVTLFVLANLITVSIVTLARAKISKSVISFLLVNLALTLWAISNYFSLTIEDKSAVLFWMRVVMLITAFLGFSIINLGDYFPNNKVSLNPKLKILTVIGLVIAAALSFTPYIIKDVTISDSGVLPVFGKAIPIYGLAMALAIVFFIRNTLKKYKEATGTSKQQILYLLVGLGSTAIFSFISNFLLIILLGETDLVAFGPVFSLIFVGFTFVSIIKHRLFEVRYLFGKLIYYTVLAIFSYISFFAVSYLFQLLASTVFSPIIYLIGIPMSFIFVLSYAYLNNLIDNRIQLSLINANYNPVLTLEKLSNDLNTTVDLQKILNRTDNVIKSTVQPVKHGIYVKEHTQQSIEEGISQQELEELFHYFQIVWKAQKREYYLLEEVRELGIETEPGLYRFSNLEVSQSISVVLPVEQDNELIAAIFLGRKEGRFPYSNREIDFITSLNITASAAIQRSLLYSEVQEFANTLQDKVDDATAKLKQKNQELETALAQLKEARRKEKDMMDIMGHELRTPLTIVRNAISMVQREHRKTGDVRDETLDKYLTMGKESIKREVNLVETLLSATKLDASRMQLALTKIDMVDVATDGIEGQKMRAEQKSLEIQYDQPEEPIYAYADRTRTQEIMDNFLNNAVKYTKEGQVTIDTWAGEEYVWTRIQDTGVGIAEKDLKNLGKKFYRAKQYTEGEKTETEEEKSKVVRPGGTGLGLYVTFELIHIMEGKLYINSEVGKGSAFTFGLPIYNGQEDEQIDQTFEEAEAAQTSESREHIVINGDAPEPPQN